MGDMCYKNVKKMPKSKTTLALNGEHVVALKNKLLSEILKTKITP
jgi:hypothetical protein